MLARYLHPILDGFILATEAGLKDQTKIFDDQIVFTCISLWRRENEKLKVKV